MRVKVCAGIVGAALLLAGCSSSNELSAAGQGVRFVEDKPGSECQLLGTATGEQSNWMSGQHGEEGGSMRGAANALRNQAAAMGGNVIYGVSSPTQGMLSSFVPTASQMNGQVLSARTDFPSPKEEGKLALPQLQIQRRLARLSANLTCQLRHHIA
jgi:hypothetical protein